MKKNFLYFLFLGALGVLPTLISSFILFLLYQNSTFLNNPSLAVTTIFFSIVSISMPLALTPTTFISIISGYFFGWEGLTGIVISYFFASYIGLKLGKLLRKKGLFFHPEAGSKLEEIMTNFGDNQLMFIAFARLSPVLPFAMTNIALASIQLKLKDYLIGSILGMLPRTFIFFYAGKNARNIWNFVKDPHLEGAYNMIPIALILVSTAGLYWIVKRKLKTKSLRSKQ